MSENLIIALQITLVGMGLVFGVIIVLWGAMALLVRLTPDRAEPAAAAPEEDQSDLKRRAASVAVAVALACEATAPHEFPEPPTAIVTAWQAVQRSRYLTQRALQRRLRR